MSILKRLLYILLLIPLMIMMGIVAILSLPSEDIHFIIFGSRKNGEKDYIHLMPKFLFDIHESLIK